MTALTILHVEAGRHLYGGALQVYYLLCGLKERGCRNILVCPQDSSIAAAAHDAAEIIALPMGGDLDFGFITRLRRVIREKRPDLVHLHSRRGADMLGGIAARLEKVPVILTRRVDNPESRFIARFKYRLYDKVLTISEGIRQVLIAEGVPAGKVECVHSAVDCARYRPECDHAWFNATFGVEPGDRVIGMVAQFIERKGHRHLLVAISELAREFPRLRVLLFGKGPLEAEVAAQVREFGLESRVHFGGFREDLERVLPCLELLAHPAEMEGLGVSLLQAAACAVPIVASAVGGIPEAVRHGENGLLVPPADPAALTAALAELLRDSVKARRLGDAGRRLVEREFSIAAMVEGNLAAYRRQLKVTPG
jgi:glycosyltransferase involved in cell wall biosynthesis